MAAIECWAHSTSHELPLSESALLWDESVYHRSYAESSLLNAWQVCHSCRTIELAMSNGCVLSVASMKAVTIYCDGACQGNPGPGGWAAVLQYGEKRKEICGAVAATTNNRMELQAAIEGLRALKEGCEVEVFTDSEYLRNGITSWVRGWKYKGWMTKEKKPVKNADLWRELDALASGHKVTWHWLKGHAGHVDNERCDELAVEQIAVLRKRCKPEELKRALKEFKEQAAATGASKLL